jgi:hypothetical protein
MLPPRFLAAAAAALTLAAGPAAHATILSGPIMIEPPAVLGPNAIGDPQFFAFYEKQNMVLDHDVKVGKKVWIDKGTLVSSNYILYDPTDLVRQSVTITFDSEILGVITKNKKLKKTDFMGRDDVEYKKFRHRGREHRDRYVISPDGQSITFYFRANDPGDYVRVITAGVETPPPPPPPPIDPPPNAPLPEPGAALLFGVGAALVKLSTGRRSRPSR